MSSLREYLVYKKDALKDKIAILLAEFTEDTGFNITSIDIAGVDEGIKGENVGYVVDVKVEE